ncbi:MAG: DUF4118 domain-containing protein [Deltaproteobacteria bacterium]|nr:MAG: DUF4118 domain-containing protein [Deltaproteobacteria bacterium]
MSLRSEITEAQNARARRLPRTVSYLVAVSAALVAAFARYALDPIWGSKLPYMMFYPAVALAAWLGGLGAGLVATAVSAVCALLFLPPLGSLRVDDPSDFIGLAVFSLMKSPRS